MSGLVLILITGVGLGALYFLVASGLSLIYGLMHVLNFAHGAFLTLSAFVGWSVASAIGATTWSGFLISVVVGAVVGAVFAALTELVLIRPLYERHIEQVLVTVGLSFAAIALFEGIWGTDPIHITGPGWLTQTTDVLGASIPNKYWVLILAAALVLAGLVLFLQKTRYGMIIRAGVENREMVEALGFRIDRLFIGVFMAGSALAAMGGAMWAGYQGLITPALGSELMVMVFIVVIIGGLGSIQGSLLGALMVGLTTNYVAFLFPKLSLASNMLLMMAILLWRPNGLRPAIK